MIERLLVPFFAIWFVGSLIFGIKNGFILAITMSFIFIFIFILFRYIDSWYFNKIGYKKVPNIMDVNMFGGKLCVRKEWKDRIIRL